MKKGEKQEKLGKIIWRNLRIKFENWTKMGRIGKKWAKIG